MPMVIYENILLGFCIIIFSLLESSSQKNDCECDLKYKDTFVIHAQKHEHVWCKERE